MQLAKRVMLEVFFKIYSQCWYITCISVLCFYAISRIYISATFVGFPDKYKYLSVTINWNRCKKTPKNPRFIYWYIPSFYFFSFWSRYWKKAHFYWRLLMETCHTIYPFGTSQILGFFNHNQTLSCRSPSWRDENKKSWLYHFG